MSVYRTKKQQIAYDAYCKTLSPTECVFCAINKSHEQYISEGKHFYVITNKFPYAFWDGQIVKDHIMLVPKKHHTAFGQMTHAEKIEFLSLVERYEELGYDMYARTPQSIIKSVAHQHTHLIKTDGTRKNVALLIKKPHVLFLR